MCVYCENVADHIHDKIKIQKIPGNDAEQVQFLVTVDYEVNVGSIVWRANGKSESFIFTDPESTIVMNIGYKVSVPPIQLIELDSSGDLFSEAVNELVHSMLKDACERGNWKPYFSGKVPFPAVTNFMPEKETLN